VDVGFDGHGGGAWPRGHTPGVTHGCGRARECGGWSRDVFDLWWDGVGDGLRGAVGGEIVREGYGGGCEAGGVAWRGDGRLRAEEGEVAREGHVGEEGWTEGRRDGDVGQNGGFELRSLGVDVYRSVGAVVEGLIENARGGTAARNRL